MNNMNDIGHARLLPLPGRVRMTTYVTEHVQMYRVGESTALPMQTPGAVKSRRFLEPTRVELPVSLPSSVRLDQGVREIVSDPTADPKR